MKLLCCVDKTCNWHLVIVIILLRPTIEVTQIFPNINRSQQPAAHLCQTVFSTIRGVRETLSSASASEASMSGSHKQLSFNPQHNYTKTEESRPCDQTGSYYPDLWQGSILQVGNSTAL